MVHVLAIIKSNNALLVNLCIRTCMQVLADAEMLEADIGYALKRL